MISADLINQIKHGQIHFLNIKKTAIDKRGEPCNSCDDNTAALNIPEKEKKTLSSLIGELGGTLDNYS
jgi:hypothetical protein